MLLVGEQGWATNSCSPTSCPMCSAPWAETANCRSRSIRGWCRCSSAPFPKAEVGAYDDRTLIDKDGNKALRLIPFAAKGNEPDYLGADGLGAAISTARRSPISRTRRSWCPIRRGSRNSATGLQALPGKKVGICWRSMMLGAKRAKYYSPLEGWGPILKTPGVSFVNLQYGDCAEELARAQEHVRRRPSIRSKAWICSDDIDGAAALSAGARSGHVRAHRGGGDGGQRRHRGLVPDRRPHLAAARHR